MTVQLLETRYGRMLSSDTDIGQFDWLRLTGAYWEELDIQECQNLLSESPRGICIDVGASFGCWTLALEPYAEKVIAFEPQLPVYQMLCGSIALNNLSRKIELHNCALWGWETEAQIPMPDFSKPETNSGGISIMPNPEHMPELPREKIDAYPLHYFVKEDEHVSFIKIDVEGAEWHVLGGALEIIARCRPLMFIEAFHPYGDKERLVRQISAMNYLIEDRGNNFLCMPYNAN